MSGTRTRITVVETDGMGGLIHYAYQMCAALADAGAEVTLVTSRHYELAHLPHRFTVDARLRLWPTIERRGRGGRAARAAAGVLRKLRRGWRAVVLTIEWARLTRHLLHTRPDVVQFSTIRFPYLAIFLRRLARAGLNLTQVCHEWEFREARVPLIERIHRRMGTQVYRCFSAVFLHGTANRDAFHAAFPDVPVDRLHVIPHGDESLLTAAADDGGDLRERYGIPIGRPVVVFFGGLRPSKGLDDLLAAHAIVSAEAEASLVIAGHPSGVDPDRLRAEARRLGIAGEVTIDDRYLALGEIGPLMRTAALVVLPYRSATASGVLQTAYAFGRPVVVTDTGGLPDAVVDGGTGLIVPPGDPDALGRAILKLVTDPGLAERMGADGARLAADRFGWDPIARRVLAASDGRGNP